MELGMIGLGLLHGGTPAAVERLRLRVTDLSGNKMLAVMRNKFGGHAIQKS